MTRRRLRLPLSWQPIVLCLLLSLILCPASTAHAARVDGWNGHVVEMVATAERSPRLVALARYSTDNGITFRWALYESADGGRTWTPSNMRGLEDVLPPKAAGGQLRALAADPSNPRILYLNAGPIGQSHFFRRSGDGDWAAVGDSITLSALAVHPRDASTLYGFQIQVDVCPYGSVVRSNDGGLTWSVQKTNRGEFAPPMRKLIIDPITPTRMYAHFFSECKGNIYSSILRSDEPGQWQELTLPSGMSQSTGTFFAAGLTAEPTSGTLYAGSRFRPLLPEHNGRMIVWRAINPEATSSEVRWSEVFGLPVGNFNDELAPLVVLSQPLTTTFFASGLGLDSALWRVTEAMTVTMQHLQLPLPLHPPGTDSAAECHAATDHCVSGEWLRLAGGPIGVESFGYPRTDVIADPIAGGQTAQYFQRGVLEWHPENPPQYRVQRRLLGDILYPGSDPPVDPRSPAARPPKGDYLYFPLSADAPTGLGHYVADYTVAGQPTYFKEFFDIHGGVDAFGFPKEEPKQRDGQWTQRFQAAVFEYHPENDIDGVITGTNVAYRNFRVQLRLLGDEYIAKYNLPYIDPPPTRPR